MPTINITLMVAILVINLAILFITSVLNPVISKSQCPAQHWNSAVIILGGFGQICWCLVVFGLLRLLNLQTAGHR